MLVDVQGNFSGLPGSNSHFKQPQGATGESLEASEAMKLHVGGGDGCGTTPNCGKLKLEQQGALSSHCMVSNSYDHLLA